MIASVSSDNEIHNWRSEIPINAMKHGGTHNSQRRKTGLTALMWIVSAIHAAVNF